MIFFERRGIIKVSKFFVVSERERSMRAIWFKGKRHEINCHGAFLLRAKGLGERALLRIAAGDIYRIHVNGEFAHWGPAKTANGRSPVDEIPLGKYLNNGEAVIAVEITGYAIDVLGTCNDEAFFSAEVVEGDRTVYTAYDFEAYLLNDTIRKVSRYSWQRHFVECYRMEKDRRSFYLGNTEGRIPSEIIDVKGNNRIKRVVRYPSFETVWAETPFEAGSIGHAPVENPYTYIYMTDHQDNGFSLDEIDPLVHEFQSMVFEKNNRFDAPDGYRMYDLGRDLAGFIRVELTVKKAARLYVIWDEVVQENGRIDPIRMHMTSISRYELAEGEYSLESMEPYTLKYIQTMVEEGEVEIRRVGVRTYENPDAGRLAFSSADKTYELLMEAARNTFAQNAPDIFMDCPSRERAGWLCDSFFTGQSEYLFTGVSRVEKHFLDNYAHCPEIPYMPEGMIPMCYPGEFMISKKHPYIANWALWYLLELETYLTRTHDEVIREDSRKKVDGLLRFFEKHENEFGLLENVPGWTFVEWSMANDPEFVKGINFPSSMLYSGALRAIAKAYDRPELSEKADRIVETIRSMARLESGFWCDNAVRDGNGKPVLTGNTSETCQYYAFFFGIATPERDGELFRILLEEFGADRVQEECYPTVHKANAFIGNILRMAYLSENGYAEAALSQVVDYYLYMAERTNTLWEYNTPHKSCNHGFASFIATVILRSICGYDGCTDKVIRIREAFDGMDAYAKLPLDDTRFVTITVKDGVRTVDAPEGYTVKNV